MPELGTTGDFGCTTDSCPVAHVRITLSEVPEAQPILTCPACGGVLEPRPHPELLDMFGLE